MNGQHRQNVRAGDEVDIIRKQDQGSGKLTRGIVKDILTNSSFHPHGIKVRLMSGEIGRVQEVLDPIDKSPSLSQSPDLQ
ncbi:MAG: YwbE family protein [Blastocatellia bacterium]